MYNAHEVEVERIIKAILVRDSLKHKQRVSIQVLSMYEAVMASYVNHTRVLSTRDFNGVVQSMKRAGIVGTAKGGEIIFLSPGAYARYVQPKLDAAAAEAAKQAPAASGQESVQENV